MPVQIDFIARHEVAIARPAACVWAHILRPNAWKKGARLEHADGPTDGKGEWFAARAAGSAEILYYAQNIELVPERRRTVKLSERRDGGLIGFASWGLREEAGTTIVTYDVYAQFQMAEDADLSVQRERFDEELRDLRRLVEGD